MRRKKHKHTRKAVRLFRIQYGFRQPFKVLLDGNFVHAMHQLRMKSAADLLPKLLGGTCRLFTTSCIQHELKKLGPDFADAQNSSKQLLLHKCEHTGSPVAPTECIRSLIGTDNANHFFVATQDKHLRHALLKIPAGAVINCSANGLHLAQPSTKQEAAIDKAEAARRLVPAQEATALKPLLGKRAPSTPQYNDSRFVRKRPKAPNPLACKPKLAKERVQRPSKKRGLATEDGGEAQQGMAPGAGSATSKAGSVASKSRTRKRVRKPKQAESDA